MMSDPDGQAQQIANARMQLAQQAQNTGGISAQ